MKTHPHAEAEYRVVPLDDGSFGVEVAIPDSSPTRVTSFATEDDAEAWIAKHRATVTEQATSGRFFSGRARGRPPGPPRAQGNS